MHRKLVFAHVFALIFVFAVPFARAQVAPQASEHTLPLSVGAGVSDFDLDWGHDRRMIGITAWVDWRLPIYRTPLRGLGLQVEGREIDWARPDSLPGMRQETGLGGVTYVLPLHHRRFHIYGKYLLGFGGVYFGTTGYDHDTRTVFAPGGGIDFQVSQRLLVRADYEYQYWRQLLGPHDLTPQGPTVGVLYTFSGRRHFE